VDETALVGMEGITFCRFVHGTVRFVAPFLSRNYDYKDPIRGEYIDAFRMSRNMGHFYRICSELVLISSLSPSISSEGGSPCKLDSVTLVFTLASNALFGCDEALVPQTAISF